MKNKLQLSTENLKLFKEKIAGTKPLLHDVVSNQRLRTLEKKIKQQRLLKANQDANYYFSDEYQPLLPNHTRYIKSDLHRYELNKLRRGYYTPKILLDLHGLTQQQAKQEISALIVTCSRNNIHCACIMHGHGKHILKNKIPLWLAQHPNINAFHQAPKIWGGNASLLILLETNNHQSL